MGCILETTTWICKENEGQEKLQNQRGWPDSCYDSDFFFFFWALNPGWSVYICSKDALRFVVMLHIADFNDHHSLGYEAS